MVNRTVSSQVSSSKENEVIYRARSMETICTHGSAKVRNEQLIRTGEVQTDV